MIKNILRFSFAMLLIVGLAMVTFATFARADGDRGERYRHGDYRYRHHDGMWYTHDEVVVVQRAPSVQVNL